MVICVILDDVIVLGVPDVDAAAQQTQQIVIVLRPRQSLRAALACAIAAVHGPDAATFSTRRR
jgi:hypothetical protein